MCTVFLRDVFFRDWHRFKAPFTGMIVVLHCLHASCSLHTVPLSRIAVLLCALSVQKAPRRHANTHPGETFPDMQEHATNFKVFLTPQQLFGDSEDSGVCALELFCFPRLQHKLQKAPCMSFVALLCARLCSVQSDMSFFHTLVSQGCCDMLS